MHSLAYIAHFLFAIFGVIAIFWLAKRQFLPAGVRPGRDIPIWAFGAGVLAIVTFEVSLFWASAPLYKFWDYFAAYYPAGVAVIENDHTKLKALIGEGAGGFVNIPDAAYLFAPLAALPPSASIAVFTLIGIVLTVAAWATLVRLGKLENRERWLLAFLFLVNGPLICGIKFGNTSYFLLYALALGLVLVRSGRSDSAGALLGVAAVIKPPLALFGLFFLLRRDWRGVLSFAGVGVATALLSFLLFGWEDDWYWFEKIEQYSHSWLANYINQAIPAFIVRLRETPEILVNWLPQSPTPAEEFWAHAITGGIMSIAGAACLRFTAPQAPDAPNADAAERCDLQYVLVICLSLVASPLTWSHYFVWMLMPAALFLGVRQSWTQRERLAGWTAIALITPVVLWPQSDAHTTTMAIYTSVIASNFLFGALLWFGLICWRLAKTGGLLTASGRQGFSWASVVSPLAFWRNTVRSEKSGNVSDNLD